MTETGDIFGRVFGSVWGALEDDFAKAADSRLRSAFVVAVQQTVAG